MSELGKRYSHGWRDIWTKNFINELVYVLPEHLGWNLLKKKRSKWGGSGKHKLPRQWGRTRVGDPVLHILHEGNGDSRWVLCNECGEDRERSIRDKNSRLKKQSRPKCLCSHPEGHRLPLYLLGAAVQVLPREEGAPEALSSLQFFIQMMSAFPSIKALLLFLGIFSFIVQFLKLNELFIYFWYISFCNKNKMKNSLQSHVKAWSAQVVNSQMLSFPFHQDILGKPFLNIFK